jgi:hypothetical protein
MLPTNKKLKSQPLDDITSQNFLGLVVFLDPKSIIKLYSTSKKIKSRFDNEVWAQILQVLYHVSKPGSGKAAYATIQMIFEDTTLPVSKLLSKANSLREKGKVDAMSYYIRVFKHRALASWDCDSIYSYYFCYTDFKASRLKCSDKYYFDKDTVKDVLPSSISAINTISQDILKNITCKLPLLQKATDKVFYLTIIGNCHKDLSETASSDKQKQDSQAMGS